MPKTFQSFDKSLTHCIHSSGIFPGLTCNKYPESENASQYQHHDALSHHLNYCTGLLAGLPACILAYLQSGGHPMASLE